MLHSSPRALILITPSLVAFLPPGEGPQAVTKETAQKEAGPEDGERRKQLCPYAAAGECRYGVNCAYLHGDVCDMCGLQVLHPTDGGQRSDHTKVTTATTALPALPSSSSSSTASCCCCR